MKILIVGLGNLGERYENTRHNAGFIIVDRLALGFEKECGVLEGWEFCKRLESEIIRLPPSTHRLVFAKPATLMNSSGRVVRRLVEEFGIDFDGFLLVHDELDLLLGDFRLQKGRGSSGHKGVQSVIDSLGSRDFWRLRVGIGRPPEGSAVEDYVLEGFTSGEREIIDRLIDERLAKVVQEWVATKF